MIDKNKAYRFRGDSERWVWDGDRIWRGFWNGGLRLDEATGKYLHERGILLEYPELPGEDWEFCEAGPSEMYWSDGDSLWLFTPVVRAERDGGIYCRKKKPVITEFEVVVESLWATGDRIYLPSGFAGPGDKVKVTKL